MLVISVKIGDWTTIGRAKLCINKRQNKDGWVKITIDAPKDIVILRAGVRNKNDFIEEPSNTD